MKAALVSVLLLPCIGVAAGEPFERRCEREMTPRFEVSSSDPGVRVHNTVSSRVLNTRGTYNVAGQAMMGMTASTTRAEIEIDGPSLQDPASGRECIAPRVAVTLSYQPLEVFVAREFHPHSCAYRQVYAHEMRHVAIYREHLPRLERTVREALVRRYGGGPLYAAAGQGLNQLQHEIDNWLRPLIKLELARIETFQVALDSPEESFRLSHSCLGEVETAMGSSF